MRSFRVAVHASTYLYVAWGLAVMKTMLAAHAHLVDGVWALARDGGFLAHGGGRELGVRRGVRKGRCVGIEMKEMSDGYASSGCG